MFRAETSFATAVAADVVERVVRRDPLTAAADLDGQLRFGVDVRRLGGRTIRSPGPISVFANLPKMQRLGGRVVAELGGVLGVVPPDANDLHAVILTI